MSQVFRFGWWMGMYGASTPKRHHGFSNNRWASLLDLGIYRRAEQAKKTIKTVKRYVSKEGKRAYTGTKHLKQSQWGPHLLLNLLLAGIVFLINLPLSCEQIKWYIYIYIYDYYRSLNHHLYCPLWIDQSIAAHLCDMYIIYICICLSIYPFSLCLSNLEDDQICSIWLDCMSDYNQQISLLHRSA